MTVVIVLAVTEAGLTITTAEAVDIQCISRAGYIMYLVIIYSYVTTKLRDRSLFIGITESGKFNWNFSRFSWPVYRIFKQFKARTSYHNFFQDPSGTNTDFFTFVECPKIFSYKTGNTNGNSDSFDIVFSIVGTGKQQCSFPHF